MTTRIAQIVADVEGRMAKLTEAQRADVNVQRTLAAMVKIKAASPEWHQTHDRDSVQDLLRAAEGLR